MCHRVGKGLQLAICLPQAPGPVLDLILERLSQCFERPLGRLLAREIGVRLQDRDLKPVGVTVKHPGARDRDDCAIPLAMDQLILPAALGEQNLPDLFQGLPKHRLKKSMRDLVEHLLFTIAVQLGRTGLP